jgi:hypothetical protein
MATALATALTLRIYRRRFKWALVVSVVALVIVFAAFGEEIAELWKHDPPQAVGVGPNVKNPDDDVPAAGPTEDYQAQDLTFLVAITSLVTSVLGTITSLIGFGVTTFVSFRKEKRESALASIEIEKQRLQLQGLMKNDQADQGTNSPAIR